jgi:outer membrane protein assembly factor BamA
MPTCRTRTKRWAFVFPLAAAAGALLTATAGRTAAPPIIEAVEYQGAKHLKDEDLNTLSGVRKGEPLDPVRNRAACQRIVARLREDGRPFATCELLSGGAAGDTRVVFNITEGPKVKVAGVEVTGNQFVSAAVLKSHMRSSRLAPAVGALGGPYNRATTDEDVRAIEDYYHSFGFHEAHASCEVRWAQDGSRVQLVFHIEEGPRTRARKPEGPEPASSLVPLIQPW